VVTSGIRLGSQAATTRGFGEAEFVEIGGMISDVLNALASDDEQKLDGVQRAVRQKVEALTSKFPIYTHGQF
jgi:glycine hydroxymethyltransferase